MYYCDECGERDTSDAFVGISRLPVNVASARKDESAILCPKCVREKLTFAVSFTRTYRDWVDEEIEIDSNINFVFGCTKDHALCADDMIPNDIAYATGMGFKRVIDGHLIKKEDVLDGSELAKTRVSAWETFKEIIRKADADGRVWWKEEWMLGGQKPFYLNEITEQLVAAGFLVIGGV